MHFSKGIYLNGIQKKEPPLKTGYFDMTCIVRHWISLVFMYSQNFPTKSYQEVRRKGFADSHRVTSPGMSHFCGLLPAAAHELERLR